MSHHPKKTLQKHWLQLSVLVFGLILWFIPTPSGLETQAWHLFAIFITAIFAVIINAILVLLNGIPHTSVLMVSDTYYNVGVRVKCTIPVHILVQQ